MTNLRDALHAVAEPVTGYDVGAVAIRTARRRRAVRYVVAPLLLVIAVAAAVIVPFGPADAPEAPPAAPPTATALPLSVYSVPPWVGSARDDPPGRAVAVLSGEHSVVSGDISSPNQVMVVVGAQPGVYRTVETPKGRSALSPDGTYLALDTGIMDLRTGRTLAYQKPGHLDLVPVAWFPDGSRVVVVGQEPGDRRTVTEGLGIVDVRTGQFRRFAGSDTVDAATVSPDGLQIAYVDKGRLVARPLSGAARSFALPPDTRLAGHAAWTPDGRSIAVVTVPECCRDGAASSESGRWQLRLIDARTGAVAPPAYPDFLGSRFALLGWRDGGRAAVVDTGLQAVLAGPGTASPADLIGYDCLDCSLDVAGDVLADGTLTEWKPAGFRQVSTGWSTFFIAAGLVALGLLAGFVWIVLRTRRSVRRSRPSP